MLVYTKEEKRRKIKEKKNYLLQRASRTSQLTIKKKKAIDNNSHINYFLGLRQKQILTLITLPSLERSETGRTFIDRTLVTSTAHVTKSAFDIVHISIHLYNTLCRAKELPITRAESRISNMCQAEIIHLNASETHPTRERSFSLLSLPLPRS
jgi:hypothetical protein